MRTLPNVPGTVVNWPMQGSLADISGHGLDNAIEGGGTEVYADMGGMEGFSFNATKMLIQITAPTSHSDPTLYILGNLTLQWCSKISSGTPDFTYIQMDPGVKLLYSVWHHHANGVTYSDQNTSTAFGGVFDDGAFHFWTLVRELVSGTTYSVKLYRDGSQVGSTLTTTLVTGQNNEVLHVGGWNGGPNTHGIIGNIRILNVARAAADVASDNDYITSTFTGLKTTAEYIPDISQKYRPFYYLKITGLPYYFFSIIDPTDSKWGSAQWTLPDGYTSAKGMDVPNSTLEQALPDLIGGIASAERVTLAMMDFDVTDANGTHSFFGRLLAPGRMTSNTSAITGLLWDDLPAGTEPGMITVRGTGGAFTAQDTYIGGETVGLSSVSGPTDGGLWTLTIDERNKYPCHSGYPPNGSYYVPLDAVGTVIPSQSVLVTQGDPFTFVNRSAALYIGHLTPDGRPEPEANSLCRIVGHVKGISYGREPGKYEFTVESVMSDIATAKVAPRLAHGDLAPNLYLGPAAWRTFTMSITATVDGAGSAQYSKTYFKTYTIDDGSLNNYDNVKTLCDLINKEFAKPTSIVHPFGTIELVPDGSTHCYYKVSAHIFDDQDGRLGFRIDLPDPSTNCYSEIKFGFAPYANEIDQGALSNSRVGLLSVMGFTGAETIQASPGTTSGDTPTASYVASRKQAVCFIPLAASEGGVTVGLLHSGDGSSRRFFTDQGDGSGTAYVRYGDGQVGQILATNPTQITVGRPPKRSLFGLYPTWRIDGGTFYYVENGQVATVDQVIRIPTDSTSSAQFGLFQLLASKGYDTDQEFNVFPDGVGLGLDGILDKASFRRAAFRFTTSFAVDIDATTVFKDIWTGIAKEQGMFLVWDPATTSIALRELSLGNYAAVLSPSFTESNRAAVDDRTRVTVDETNLRTGWVVRYGWDPIEKKFMAPEITINDSFASNSYQISSRTETIEDRTIPVTESAFVAGTVIQALMDRSTFTRYPWLSATRTMNKTGLLISPGTYHAIADNTINNPFTGELGISLDDGVLVWVTKVQSVLETGLVTVTFLIDQTTDSTLIRPWSPTGLLNFAAAHNGYDTSTGVCTMASWYTRGDHDGVDFAVGDKVALVPRDNDGAPEYYLTGTVSAVATDGTTVTIDPGAGTISSTKETIMILQDWNAQIAYRKTGAGRTSFQGNGDTLTIDTGIRLHKWT